MSCRICAEGHLCGKMHGKALKWTLGTASPPLVCACRGPYNFFDGVLLIELVTDVNGNTAPRLNDLVLTAQEAREYHHTLVRQVVRMLCAGVVHGDLSEYVLAGSDGLVVIDLPQAIDAAGNNSARSILLRDMHNLSAYFGRFAPELLMTDYGSEIWSLYQSGKLHPGIELTGRVEHSSMPAGSSVTGLGSTTPGVRIRRSA